jgi:hypothetical protein
MIHLSNDSLGDTWLERELQHVNFGDKRLSKRLVDTSILIERKASGSLNESCGTWKAAKGAYRLLSHQKFETQKIYGSHYKETRERLKGHKFVFSLQDTTYLDFDSHVKTQGLGSISKAYTKHKKGLILHSALLVSLEGLPLGLTSQQCWARVVREENSKEKSSRQYRTSSQNKESYKWITSLKETMQSIPEETQVITLGDRESDIFEFLWEAHALGTLFVIRNRQDRRFICSDLGKTKVQTSLNKLSTKQEITFEVPGKGSQKSRQATIEIKYMFGLIPVRAPSLYGSKKTEHKIRDRVAVYVVSAKEMNPPEGVEALDWTLLTNVPVTSFEEAIERIKWYKLRWKIEEYFKILKSGCKIENSRLSTREKLEKLIAIKSIIAFKILYLSKVALSHPEEICTKILTSPEWKALYMHEHQTILLPEEPPTIKQALIWLGKLGGFLNRKNDKWPGALTLWRGYENLRQSMKMLAILRPQNCG